MNADGYNEEREDPRSIVPCNTCRYRQRELDPEGCFREHNTTGIIGLIVCSICGCECYRREK